MTAILVVLTITLMMYCSGFLLRHLNANKDARFEDRQWRELGRIRLAGVERPSATPRPWLQACGVDPQQLLDLCVVKGPVAPEKLDPKLRAFLCKLHEQGNALGPEVAELATGARSLAEDEALYLISLDARPDIRFTAVVGPA